MSAKTDLANLTTTCSYDPAAKRLFHLTGKRLLRRLGKTLKETYGEYEVRSNQGGIAVSGEVTLHHDNLYIQVAQSSMGLQRSILYRTCTDRKDYTGGMNNFAPLSLLVDLSAFEALIRRNIKPQVKP